MAEPRNRMCTVVADGVVAGNVVAWGPPAERSIGYWIARELWGRGIATRALAQFVEIEPHRPLMAHVVPHNTASRRVLAKCGFVEVQGSSASGGDAKELVLRFDRAPRRA